MGIQVVVLEDFMGGKSLFALEPTSLDISGFLRATAVALAGTASTAIVISAAVTTRARAELGTFAGHSSA